jgi:hypothetical protein
MRSPQITVTIQQRGCEPIYLCCGSSTFQAAAVGGKNNSDL